MQLNSTTDKAIRCVAHIAKAERLTTATELSESLEISKEFIPVIMKSLRKAGIIDSVRGVRGGFVLGRDAQNISIYDIIEAMEKSMKISKCIDNRDTYVADADNEYKLKNFYIHLQSELDEKLKGKKITDII